jgi:hypothetical protein
VSRLEARFAACFFMRGVPQRESKTHKGVFAMQKTASGFVQVGLEAILALSRRRRPPFGYEPNAQHNPNDRFDENVGFSRRSDLLSPGKFWNTHYVFEAREKRLP